MQKLQEYLGNISEGKVLDVATGSGSFLSRVAETLKDPSRLVGIDSRPEAISKANEAFPHEPYQYICMDANKLEFENDSFDIVTIANSLHHFNNPQNVLSEMVRVLKPNGYLVAYEMIRDNQNEQQMTHVLLHDFWGRMDTQFGIVHNPTYPQKKIELMLQNMTQLEFLAKEEDKEASGEDGSEEEKQETAKMIEEIMLNYVDRAKEKKLANVNEIETEALGLIQRAKETGFASATQYLYVLKKK